MSIPPDLGYGEKGEPRAGIGKDDVMTFYITVHQTSNKETAGQADARTEMDLATLPVTIQGAIGSPVTGLKVKDASASISEKSVSVIARGTGPAVGKTGTMTVAYAAISPDGQNFQTTWGERNQGPQLAAIVGSEPLPRTEVTKKIWEYIKEHNLQDAADKRNINADAKLKVIFKKPQVSMFEMTKLISAHLS